MYKDCCYFPKCFLCIVFDVPDFFFLILKKKKEKNERKKKKIVLLEFKNKTEKK